MQSIARDLAKTQLEYVMLITMHVALIHAALPFPLSDDDFEAAATRALDEMRSLPHG